MSPLPSDVSSHSTSVHLFIQTHTCRKNMLTLMQKHHKIASQSSIRIAGPYFNRTFELLVREVECKKNYKQVHPRTDRLCMVWRSNVTKATFDNITSYLNTHFLLLFASEINSDCSTVLYCSPPP